MSNSAFSFPKKDPKKDLREKSTPSAGRKDIIKALDEFRESLVSMQKAFEKLSEVLKEFSKKAD